MLDWLNDMWNGFSGILLSALPTSPFVQWISKIEQLPYLGYVNWLIPFDDFITIGTTYLACIGLFYLYMVIARWLKVIGD